MSHVTCPKCGSSEHTSGYGLAAGPMGSYTFCDGCNALLEFCPDLDGVPEEHKQKILASIEKWRAELWGESKPQMDHVEAADCWCGPTLDYVDDDGAAVYVHHKAN